MRFIYTFNTLECKDNYYTQCPRKRDRWYFGQI